MPKMSRDTVVVLGTGGTIAGTAAGAGDNVGYTAAQVSVEQLVRDSADGEFGPITVETEQVAQLDSKDMEFSVWRALALRCRHHLARAQVRGIVITHGTDTMEESAYFLHRALSDCGLTDRPVVLTGAMRPATAREPDGPQNLRDAIRVVLQGGRVGVMVVFAGVVHGALYVRKVHTYRPDAFGSADAGPLAYVEEGQVRWLHQTPSPANGPASEPGFGRIMALLDAGAAFPRVETLSSGVGSDGYAIEAMLLYGRSRGDVLRGLVLSATGNGSVHKNLLAAALAAQAAGVAVVRAHRCTYGRIVPGGETLLPDAGELTAPKARIALMLALMTDAPAPWFDSSAI